VGLAVWAYYRADKGMLVGSAPLLEQADKLFPQFVMTAMPPGVSGLVIAGLLAVAMSSLSSGVNSACSVIKVDFVNRLRHRRPAAVDAHRDVRQEILISIVVGTIVVLLSTLVGSVRGNLLAMAYKVCNLLTAPLFGLFFMAMYVRGATVLGTHVGAACGLAVLVAVNFWQEITGTPGINFLWAMPLGLLVQITVGVMVSWVWQGNRKQNNDLKSNR
jgi:SSS family solute:Na+ symporter